MQLLGHLAAGALAAGGGARLRGGRAALLAVLLPGALGGLTPDLLDKAILALELSRYGRTVGHSLVFLVGIAVLWAGLRALRGAASAAPVGFWALGVATHVVADLCDDALRGLLHGGQGISSFFAWPFATPYAWVMRHDSALGGWPWAVSPLEVAVVGVVVLLGVGWGRGAWRLWARGDPRAQGAGSR